MTTAQRTFLRVGFHMQQFAAVFLWAADIYQWLPLRNVIFYLIAEGTILVVSTLRCFVVCLWIARLVLGNLTSLIGPLLTPAVHHSGVFVPKQLEHPEGVASPPVVLVAIEH